MISMLLTQECYNGTEYEQNVAKWLRTLGFTANTTGSDDGGVDIVAEIIIEKVAYKFYIQCKYQCTSLGTYPVQQVYTGAALYGGDGKPVIWTNNHISNNARDKAKKLGVEIIGAAEAQEINSVIVSKFLGFNRKGLLGIIEGILAQDSSYVEKCAKSLTKSIRAKEKQKEDILSLFSQAEERTRKAVRLSEESAKEFQMALDLQREALAKNLDYG